MQFEDLNNLVHFNKNSQHLYSDAAEVVIDDDLKKYFFACSEDRKSFSEELSVAMIKGGATPDQSGTWDGALRRTWLTIKGEVIENPEEQIISDLQRREEALIDTYRDFLESNDVSQPVQLILGKHLASFQTVLRHLAEWKRIEKDTDLRLTSE